MFTLWCTHCLPFVSGQIKLAALQQAAASMGDDHYLQQAVQLSFMLDKLADTITTYFKDYFRSIVATSEANRTGGMHTNSHQQQPDVTPGGGAAAAARVVQPPTLQPLTDTLAEYRRLTRIFDCHKVILAYTTSMHSTLLVFRRCTISAVANSCATCAKYGVNN